MNKTNRIIIDAVISMLLATLAEDVKAEEADSVVNHCIDLLKEIHD